MIFSFSSEFLVDTSSSTHHVANINNCYFFYGEVLLTNNKIENFSKKWITFVIQFYNTKTLFKDDEMYEILDIHYTSKPKHSYISEYEFAFIINY